MLVMAGAAKCGWVIQWLKSHTAVKNNEPDLYYHMEQSRKHIEWEKQVAEPYTHNGVIHKIIENPLKCMLLC